MNGEQLQRLIDAGESQDLEFKSGVPTGAVFQRTLASLANSGGGTLLLGVQDDGTPAGLDLVQTEHAANAFAQALSRLSSLSATLERITLSDERRVLLIDVHEAVDPLVDPEGATWVRVGARTQKVELAELKGAMNRKRAPMFAERRLRRDPALRHYLHELADGACQFPGCDVSEHLEVTAIRSHAPGGPRFDPSLSKSALLSADNYRLLCPNHHRQVDSDPVAYTVDWLLGLVSSTSTPPTPAGATVPVCFISYSWDSETHCQWVVQLARDLQSRMGVRVRLDDWDVPLGGSLTQFMEEAIETSDFVVLVLTKPYADKAAKRVRGVGYEANLLSAEILDNAKEGKLIPLVRETPKDCIPAFMRGRKYIDFQDDSVYEQQLEELARAIHNRPKAPPPPLGRPPF